TRKMMVKAGKKDSVASIARRYRVSAKQLAEWSSTAVAGKFHPGQQVVVYVPVRTSSHAMKHHAGRAVAHKATTGRKHAGAAKKSSSSTKTANR
ncbi:MAG TPA: LysM domain-containing protein, partial [Ramlibacter sp.]